MSGSKINDYSIGDENIQSVMLTLDKAYKGLHQVSLTNYDNTSESQIAAGSVVENNGALYQFTSNESITGSPSNGTVYIRLVPAGDSITAEYTNTKPTWSDSKQGWYGTGGNANKRYIGGVTKSGTSWTYKFILIDKNGLGLQYFKNTFSLGAIEELILKKISIEELISKKISIEELILKKISIEDLQMYAYGHQKIFEWTSVNNSNSASFNILKPMEISTSFDNTTHFLYPGTYRLAKGASGTPNHSIQRKVKAGTWATFSGSMGPSVSALFSIFCIYAEGTNSLSDITRLIS